MNNEYLEVQSQFQAGRDYIAVGFIGKFHAIDGRCGRHFSLLETRESD